MSQDTSFNLHALLDFGPTIISSAQKMAGFWRVGLRRVVNIGGLTLVLIAGCALPTSTERMTTLNKAIGRSSVKFVKPVENPAAMAVFDSAHSLANRIAQIDEHTDQCSRYQAEFIEFHAYERIRIHKARAALKTWQEQTLECKSWQELDLLTLHGRRIAMTRSGDDMATEAMTALASINRCRHKIISHNERRYCDEIGENVQNVIKRFGDEIRRNGHTVEWSVSSLKCPESAELKVPEWKKMEILKERSQSIASDLEKLGLKRLKISNGKISVTLNLQPGARAELMNQWANQWGYIELGIGEVSSLFTIRACPAVD